MNLLIELAMALGAKLNTLGAELGMGNVTVTSFNNGSYSVAVNGDVYAWNINMGPPEAGGGWFKPDVGDYAPSKYKEELEARLLKGCIHLLRLGVPVEGLGMAPTGINQAQSTELGQTVYKLSPDQPPAAPATKKAYRRPASQCSRCKGKGKVPYLRDGGRCYKCNGTGVEKPKA